MKGRTEEEKRIYRKQTSNEIHGRDAAQQERKMFADRIIAFSYFLILLKANYPGATCCIQQQTAHINIIMSLKRVRQMKCVLNTLALSLSQSLGSVGFKFRLISKRHS